MTAQEIIDEALKLSPENRVTIAEHLYESVDEMDDDPELKALLDRRWNEIVTGKVRTLTLEETLAKAGATLHDCRSSRQP